MASATVAELSMNINQAARKYKSGELSWDEYLDQLLARLAGDGHEDDARGQGSLEYIDPMAAYIYSWSRDMDWWIDPSTIKPIFIAYRSNASLAELQTALNGIKKPESQSWVKICLAQLAVEDRKPGILKWLLDEGGFGICHQFKHEANCVDPEIDPETFRVLEQAEFRKTWPRRPPTPEELRDPDEVYDESKVISGEGYEFDLDEFIENLDSTHPLY